MATSKLSAIAASGANIASGNQVVAVTGGAVDILFTAAQLASALPNLILQTDKGTVGAGTVTFTASTSPKQKLQISGNLTIAYTGWPASGTYGEVEIQLVNGGLATITWPTVRWILGDGLQSTTFADMAVTLYAAGTNFVIVWTTDGGTTLYGRAS